MSTRLHPKLSAHYYGSFVVIAQLSPVAYRLQLPEGAQIHPIFHFSQLKHAVGKGQVRSTLPPNLQGIRERLKPKKVLQTRIEDKQEELEKGR